MAQNSRFHPRAADLIDGGCSGAVGNPGSYRRLAGRRHTKPGRQHASHQNFVDIVTIEPCLIERGADRHRTQRRSRHRG